MFFAHKLTAQNVKKWSQEMANAFFQIVVFRQNPGSNGLGGFCKEMSLTMISNARFKAVNIGC